MEADRIRGACDLRAETLLSLTTVAKLFDVPTDVLRKWILGLSVDELREEGLVVLSDLCRFATRSSGRLKILQVDPRIAKLLESCAVILAATPIKNTC
jgi:hypothetical protein